MNNNVNLGAAFEKMKTLDNYEVAGKTLIQGGYPVKLRKESPSGNILGLEVECSPVMMSTRFEFLQSVFGDKFNIHEMKNEGYILMVVNNKN